MKKILASLVAFAATAIFCGTFYFGIHDADAQSGGGYPSNPNFQSVRVKGSVLFPAQTVTLTVASSKTSNTTLAVDSVLQLSLTAGTYLLSYSSGGTVDTAGAGGLQIAFGLSAANNTYSTYAQCQSAPPGGLVATSLVFAAAAISSTPSSGTDCFIGATSSSQAQYMQGIVTLNATTTVGLWWAQAASSATTTTINPGATLTAVRIL